MALHYALTSHRYFQRRGSFATCRGGRTVGVTIQAIPGFILLPEVVEDGLTF